MSSSNPIYSSPEHDHAQFARRVRQVITVLKDTGSVVELDLIAFADIIWRVEQRLPELAAHIADIDRQIIRLKERLNEADTGSDSDKARLMQFIAGGPVPASRAHVQMCTDLDCPCE